MSEGRKNKKGGGKKVMTIGIQISFYLHSSYKLIRSNLFAVALKRTKLTLKVRLKYFL